MFGPLPYPGHYSRRWATMTSADSCFLTMRITLYGAVHIAFCLLIFCSYLTDEAERPITCAGTFGYRWPPPVVTLKTKNMLHGKQVYPNKNVNFRCTTAPFTVSFVPRALTCCAVLPRDSALYDVSVRRPTSSESRTSLTCTMAYLRPRL